MNKIFKTYQISEQLKVENFPNLSFTEKIKLYYSLDMKGKFSLLQLLKFRGDINYETFSENLRKNSNLKLADFLKMSIEEKKEFMSYMPLTYQVFSFLLFKNQDNPHASEYVAFNTSLASSPEDYPDTRISMGLYASCYVDKIFPQLVNIAFNLELFKEKPLIRMLANLIDRYNSDKSEAEQITEQKIVFFINLIRSDFDPKVFDGYYADYLNLRDKKHANDEELTIVEQRILKLFSHLVGDAVEDSLAAVLRQVWSGFSYEQKAILDKLFANPAFVIEEHAEDFEVFPDYTIDKLRNLMAIDAESRNVELAEQTKPLKIMMMKQN